MKKTFWLLYLLLALLESCAPNVEENPIIIPTDSISTTPSDSSYNIDIRNFKMRDPFVFVDTVKNRYLIHANSGDNKSFTVYESKNLEKWKKLGHSFEAPDYFWGKQDFWAPDMFCYNGKYYIIATFSSETANRGCAVLISDFPEGPYEPLTNRPITPADWACLDGTLYIDDNQPYLLYSREWLEVGDGQIYIQKLTEDLTATIGNPVLLFRASSASWVGAISSQGVTGLVTDAPFIYKTEKDGLIMLWSTFAKSSGTYCIGCAHSTSGSIMGPWTQESSPLNDDIGGHAMIFKDLTDKIKISYHSPNKAPSYVTIYDLDIYEGKVTIMN